MIIPQEYKPTTDLYEDAYLGSNDVFVKKLKYLSQIAQEENWDYEKSEIKEYKLLRNYLLYTYDRVKQENKIEYNENKELMCFNTGLLTPNEVDIYALFDKNSSNNAKEGQIWHLVGFYQASNRKMLEEFPKYPEIADYFTNSSDFIYDRNMDIVINYDHIVDDNYERFADIGYKDKETIKAFLKSGVDRITNKVKRNYKLAIPQFYTDKSSGESKIQLLLPLYLKDPNKAELALVIDKIKTRYVVKTILPLEWAYINSRRIIKPDVDWLKI